MARLKLTLLVTLATAFWSNSACAQYYDEQVQQQYQVSNYEMDVARQQENEHLAEVQQQLDFQSQQREQAETEQQRESYDNSHPYSACCW